MNRTNIFTTILNVIGLSVAFAAFTIILVQVRYDLEYNKCIKEYEKIFRVEGAFNKSNPESYSATFCRPLIREFGNCSPDIEHWGEFVGQGIINFQRADIENAPFVNAEAIALMKNTLNVFSFNIVAGDTTTFDNDKNILISESTAKNIFNNESPLGKVLRTSPTQEYTIIAVYKDYPDNCTIKNGIIFSLGNQSIDNMSEWSYYFYIKVFDPDNSGSILERFQEKLFEVYKDDKDITTAYNSADWDFLRITPIYETHFSKDVIYDSVEKGNKTTTWSLLTIAILIILIAIINFINFSMAAIPINIKNINTRKVLGCSNSTLRAGQIGNAVIISSLSFIISIIIVYILSDTSFSGFISGSISPVDNISLLLICLVIAILTGITAGLYPAFYSTSFSPALVVKGSFSLSPKGRHLRVALVALQYIISLVLIIVALFINVQSSYMKNYNMGFSTGNILTVNISKSLGQRAEAFAGKLKENTMISDVTFASGMIISNGKMGWGRMFNGENIRFDCFPVSPNFLTFFDMEIVEGRGFVSEDINKTNGTIIFNQATMQTYPFIKISDKIPGHADEPSDLVGVVKNFNFQPLQYKINPIALYIFGSDPWWPLQFVYIKPEQGANIKECIAYITSIVREMDPNIREENISVRFMDDRINMLYQKEDNLGSLILIFCGLSVLISIIGILGLIYFETQFKKKEIGVRRVFGSSVGDILKMLNLSYLKIASICFVISIPISLTIIKMWLKTFTYQSPIPVWIFIVAYFSIILITVLVITLQSYRTASSNPVNAIKIYL